MDTQRLILFIAVSFISLLIWQKWQIDYGPQPQQPVAEQQAAGQANGGADGSVPDASVTPAAAPSAQGAPADASVPSVASQVQKAQRVQVKTDVFDLTLDTTGGDVRVVDLLNYPRVQAKPDEPFRLMNDTRPNLFLAQSGLVSNSNKDEAPTHYSIYSAEKNEYVMAEGEDELRVPLTWVGKDGTIVVKTYIFRRGSYLIDVEHNIKNTTDKVWQGNQYRQLQRTQVEEEGQSDFIYTYMGGVIYTDQDRYEKISFSDMEDENLSKSSKNGWAAMLQHYFFGAWIPNADELSNYYSKVLQGSIYVIGMTSPGVSIQPGESATLSSRLYVGPKLQNSLEAIAPGLELTIDYGMLTFIAEPVFWILDKIYAVVGNWGWAIIFVTLLIKILFYYPSKKSYESMANMRRLHPRLTQLKERYGDDKARLNEAMMKMYKEEKVNPLGGCLPILIQMPVFIALYWVLLESVELRQAPFMLWLTDLSAKDPYYVLPLIMGASMFIQQKLNPAPIDPMQQKIMMFLPVVFTVFFMFFPSGLVLYWVVNNILSIVQQWLITRRIEEQAKRV